MSPTLSSSSGQEPFIKSVGMRYYQLSRLPKPCSIELSPSKLTSSCNGPEDAKLNEQGRNPPFVPETMGLGQFIAFLIMLYSYTPAILFLFMSLILKIVLYRTEN